MIRILKTRHVISSALLALSLSLSFASAARAQGPDKTQQTPSEAAPQTTDDGRASGSKAVGAQVGTSGGANTATQPNDMGHTGNTPAPLTGGEKMRRAFRHAFLSPAPYSVYALTAAYTEWRDDKPPTKTTADAFADWGSRTARNFATGSTKTLFASGFYPALLRQDPRYEPSRSKSSGERLKHAVSRVFVTRGDDGRLEANYSLLAGDMTASAMANIWEHSAPDHNRIGTGPTFQRFGWMLADDAINNIIFREFGPDIKRIFRH